MNEWDLPCHLIPLGNFYAGAFDWPTVFVRPFLQRIFVDDVVAAWGTQDTRIFTMLCKRFTQVKKSCNFVV